MHHQPPFQEASVNEPFVTVEHNSETGITRLGLNRPHVRNALNADMIRQLTEHFQRCSEDPGTRIIVLFGQGEMFCAGADIHGMQSSVAYTPEQNQDDAWKLHQLFQTIHQCSKPVVTVVQGGALGGGVGLAAASDIVLATETAFFSLSEVRLGLVPAVIGPFLMSAIGQRQTMALALTGERFSAAVAHNMGLVHRLTTDAYWERDLDALLEALLKGSPQAQQICKKLFHALSASTPEAHGDLTTRTIADIRTSSEGQEGLKAFLEKRQPTWVTTL